MLRQYGAAQLEADPESCADARRRHSRHYCAWLAGQSGRINTGEQERVLAAIDSEVENCRGAWEWAVAAGDSASLASAADPLFFYFEYRGRYQEGADACRISLQQCACGPTVEAERLRVRLLTWQGVFNHVLGHSEARRLLERSLAWLEELADQGIEMPAESACTRLRMGDLSKWHNITEAVTLFDASQRLYRSIGDNWGAARRIGGPGA